MAELLFKTSGSADPQGKSRVYFTCHREDFESTFYRLCKDIFKTHDCAVYYKSDMAASVDEKDRETDIGRCNLFVIPVTRQLLTTPNPAMDEELPYALSHHMRILPILMEPDLDDLYSQPDKFGDLQYLSACSTDDTQIAYADKLKKHLDTALLSAETVKQIRSHFREYIFLSYRKMDRLYANRLMRLIHDHPQCRDIAIWFDEFLTPGEDFRENIQKYLHKSKLFTLLVTPNLMTLPNFVMENEIRWAVEQDMPALPVEMVHGDTSALYDRYTVLPPCRDPEDLEDFYAELSRLIADFPHKHDAHDLLHCYLIGLAYLEGIDMEVDRTRAVGLITEAAQGDLPEAIETLIHLYTDGVGVARDPEQARHWSRQLARHWFSLAFPEDEAPQESVIRELFAHQTDLYLADTLKQFLLLADKTLDAGTMEWLMTLLSAPQGEDLTLLLDACREMAVHRELSQTLLLQGLLDRAAQGLCAPYGPLFWFVPEYDLYAPLLTALSRLTGKPGYAKAAALARDVCWIFGHYNTAGEIAPHMDTAALFRAAELTGLRRGLCQLFYTGQSDYQGGADVYPRCFNMAEARAFLDTGCGIFGRMDTPFEDELGLYAHQMYSLAGDEWMGIVAAPYDPEAIEKALAPHSGRKLRGLLLSPTERTDITYIACNRKHIQTVYLPENTASLHTGWKKDLPLTQSPALLGEDLHYFRRKLILPTTVTAIENTQFQRCRHLQHLQLPEGLTGIGMAAFQSCGALTDVQIPGSCREVGTAAFSRCAALTRVRLGHGVETIGGDAFSGCGALEEAQLPESVTTIHSRAFSKCAALKHIRLPGRLQKLGRSVFKDCAGLTELLLPPLKQIEDSAFWGCRALREVTIPRSVTQIGWSAFRACTGLTQITIPGTVKHVEQDAFRDCAGLTQVTVSRGVKAVGDSVFRDCSALKRIVLPDTVTALGAYVFKNCTGLTQAVLPRQLTDYGRDLFDNCPALETVRHCPAACDRETLGVTEQTKLIYDGKKLKTLHIMGFSPVIPPEKYKDRCDLGAVRIGPGVRVIGFHAFSHCRSLTRVSFTKGVVAVDDGAFSFCSALEEITFPATVTTVGRCVFLGCDRLKTVANCPQGYTHKDLDLPEEVTLLYSGARRPKLSLDIPGDPARIPANAYTGRKDLTKATLTEGITHIGDKAFSFCTSLEEISLPQSLLAIGDEAFRGCNSLTDISLSAGVTELGRSAFSMCDSLTEMTLPDGIREIPRGCFSSCHSLVSITLPPALETVGQNAFSFCHCLAQVRLPDTVTKLERNAFSSCKALQRISLPAGSTRIPKNCFGGCKALAHIDLPATLERIEEQAFSDCAMETLILPDGLQAVESRAFSHCPRLQEVTIPASVRTVGDSAFACCDALEEITLPRRFEDDLSRIFRGVDLSQVKIQFIG